MEGRADSREVKRRIHHTRLAGAGSGGRGATDVLIDIARGYVFGRVEASTRKAYEASWGMWVCWRSFVGKGCWLHRGMGERELAEFMG